MLATSEKGRRSVINPLQKDKKSSIPFFLWPRAPALSGSWLGTREGSPGHPSLARWVPVAAAAFRDLRDHEDSQPLRVLVLSRWRTKVRATCGPRPRPCPRCGLSHLGAPRAAQVLGPDQGRVRQELTTCAIPSASPSAWSKSPPDRYSFPVPGLPLKDL